MGGKKLPYDAEIEYLESTGTQYINTEHIATQYTEYECVGELTSTNIDTFCCLFGYHVGNIRNGSYNSLGGFCLFCNPTIVIQARTGVYGNPNIVSDTHWVANAKHTFILKYNYLTLDGNTFTSRNTLYSNPISTYIFSAHDVNAQYRRNSPAKIYRFLIRENNILVRKFIPVRVGSVGYMYDNVSGQLFGNSGTGDFILGPDKN